jgi:hypothetical protein
MSVTLPTRALVFLGFFLRLLLVLLPSPASSLFPNALTYLSLTLI